MTVTEIGTLVNQWEFFFITIEQSCFTGILQKNNDRSCFIRYCGGVDIINGKRENKI